MEHQCMYDIHWGFRIFDQTNAILHMSQRLTIIHQSCKSNIAIFVNQYIALSLLHSSMYSITTIELQLIRTLMIDNFISPNVSKPKHHRNRLNAHTQIEEKGHRCAYVRSSFFTQGSPRSVHNPNLRSSQMRDHHWTAIRPHLTNQSRPRIRRCPHLQNNPCQLRMPSA